MAGRPTAGAKKAAMRKTAAIPRGRAGASAAGYLARQAPGQRALLEKLHSLVMTGVPDATTTIKWGVPFYQRNGRDVCALAAFKEHVGINFFAPPEALADPGRKLEGGGKASRMLKVRSAGDIDSASIRRWLKAAVAAGSRR